jgi:hypothetical protein
MRHAWTTTVTAMVACLGCGDGAPPAAPKPPKERVVIDFRVRDAERAEVPGDDESAALVRAFPHPHAAGKPCDPNLPGTPSGERMGGVLLPRVTQVAGSFTRPGAKEIAFVIDYCPTGAGVPRTRRLLVLESGKVNLDHELLAAEPFDEALTGSDVDGDGRDELLLTTSIFEDARSKVDLSVVTLRGATLTTLGTWRAVEHCDPRHAERTNLVLHVRMEGGAPVFRDELTTSRCVYPPSPPGP